MEMDNSHPDTVYAATPYGVYKTVNAAENWSKIGLDGIEINSIQIAQTNSNIIIANSDTAVYKSEDRGATWTVIWQSERTVGSIAINPEDASKIWVGINVPEHQVYFPNLYRSNDGGTTWNSNDFGQEGEEKKLSRVTSLVIDPSDTSKIYVGGENDSYHTSVGCMFVSNNSGINWTAKKLTTCSSEEITALICTPTGYENHRLCAIVDGCSTNRQFFLSSDFGITWREFEVPSTFNLGSIGNNAIEINPNFPEWIFIGASVENASIVAFNIEDEEWYYLPGSPDSFPTSILINPKIKIIENSTFYIGFKQNGVYKSINNGDSWTQKNKGFNEVEVSDVVLYPNDPNKILVATPGNLAKTTDGGNSWAITGSSIRKLALNKQDTSIIFAGRSGRYYRAIIDYFKYLKSLDGEATWTYHNMFLTQGIWNYSYYMWVGDILIFPDNPDKILIGVDGGGASGEGLYRSTDGGNWWDNEYSTGVSTIAMDPTNNNIVYLGTTGLGYVSRSEDGGNSWTRISPGGTDAFVYNVRDLDVDKNNQVFAATSSGLFKWEGNEDWSLVQGFLSTNTTAIVIDNQSALPVYYVGTYGEGVFSSNDGGLTWESYNNGLEKLSITKLAISETNANRLFAGTMSGGVWSTELVVGIDTVFSDVELVTGWNWISSNVDPFVPAVVDMCAGIECLEILKSYTGFYVPGVWDGIGDWEFKQMYTAYLSCTDNLYIAGQRLNPPAEPITLV
jgi:photosystem II stability/assembly factor-like uncharacterized protein